jgi:hypothetical protein
VTKENQAAIEIEKFFFFFGTCTETPLFSVFCITEILTLEATTKNLFQYGICVEKKLQTQPELKLNTNLPNNLANNTRFISQKIV